MIFLLDTSVISEVRKLQPDAGVMRWFEATDDRAMRLSSLVLGELRCGVERLRPRDAGRAAELDFWLSELGLRFQDRLAPVTTEVAHRWGKLTAAQSLPVIDALLAATALTHEWTLVSRNELDLVHTGVRVLNPFA